jgi:glutathione S-transferase
MLRIWGRLSSINVRKVVWAAQEVGVTFDHINAGGEYGLVNTAEFTSMNPNQMVPVVDDGGFRLWESNVIVRYLAARYGREGLYPEALSERFDAERWMDWQQTTLNPAGRQAFIQLIRTSDRERDAAAIAASVSAMEPLLGLLNEHLSGSGFMLGDRLTIADIPIGCEVHRWWGLPLKRPALSHLERWYAGLLQRPAARGVLDLALS